MTTIEKNNSTGETHGDSSKDALNRFMASVEAKHKDLTELRMDKYGFGAWSISKLKVLQKCPFQFFLQYILKLKVPPEVGGRADTLSADVGSAAHRVLEFVMKGKPVPVSFKLTKEEYVPSKLTEAQWVEHLETLELSVIKFKERMDAFADRNPVKRVFTEMRIGVTKDWDACAFFDEDAYFRGIIDLCLQLENNDLVIIDHKTGLTAESSIRPFETQLNSYKPLFHFGLNKIEGAQAGLHLIKAGEVKMAQYHSKEEIEGKLRRQLEWEFDGAVDTVKELGFFKHVRGPYCKWCSYDCLGCKAGDLKPMELDTKRLVIPIKKV